ncbi:MAG TPA: hypothetical protein VER03_06050 [Bryobacteraceae bacterium]|nr:hypothetical protein [Bryobacteraceae bacterium]
MFCSARTFAIALIALFVTACGSNEAGRTPEALVFVPFDYLGPSAGASWAGRATAGIAASQTSSLTAPSIRDAITNRARHIVQGYVSGHLGALTAVVTIRDEADQRTIRTLHARGKDVLVLASMLASQLVAKPVPYTTASSEAVRELYAGKPEAAVALDPKFGAAQLALVEALRRGGKNEEAQKAIAAARTANLSPVERAQLEALTAQTPKDRSEALLRAAQSARGDLAMWLSAAEAAMTAKDHAGAAEAYRRATLLDPENIAYWNSLAYAEGFAGNLDAAKQSIAQYQKLQPRDANAYDSMGEIYFYEGRFGEAEEQFLRAFEMDNSRLGGGEAYRAALAAYLAGDKVKAAANFNRYLNFRKQQKDAFLGLREAIWLYSTGRADAARQKAAAELTPAAKSQIAIWDAVEGKGAASFGDRQEFSGWKLIATGQYAEAAEYWKKVYDGSSVSAGGDARVLLAFSLRKAGRTSDSDALMAKWPLPPMGPEPGFSSVVFARAVELKAARR